jgi:hypothetical protein
MEIVGIILILLCVVFGIIVVVKVHNKIKGLAKESLVTQLFGHLCVFIMWPLFFTDVL